ncbi:hypothetical protein D3C81_2190150 [compost metagenome]
MFLELPADAITIKVGNKKSAAQFYVDTQQEAVQLIEYFAYNKKKQEEIKASSSQIKIETYDENSKT